MLAQTAPAVNVLPAEEQEILLQHGLDVAVREVLAYRAAMLVMHDAGGLVEHFPAAFPGQIAEIGVFEIKGREEVIEAAEFKEFAAIESATAAAAVEAGKQSGSSCIHRSILTMADAQ